MFFHKRIILYANLEYTCTQFQQFDLCFAGFVCESIHDLTNLLKCYNQRKCIMFVNSFLSSIIASLRARTFTNTHARTHACTHQCTYTRIHFTHLLVKPCCLFHQLQLCNVVCIFFFCCSTLLYDMYYYGGNKEYIYCYMKVYQQRTWVVTVKRFSKKVISNIFYNIRETGYNIIYTCL